MGWIPDQTDSLVLELTQELHDVAGFCFHWNGPAQRAFAEHIKLIGKPIEQLTVSDLKTAAAHAELALREQFSGGMTL